jgi:hypothetical protein
MANNINKDFEDWIKSRVGYLTIPEIKANISLGDLKPSTLKKEDWIKIILEQKTLKEIYNINKEAFGITSAMVMEKFGISKSQKSTLQKNGILKVVGTYVNSHFGKKINAYLYDAEQYFDEKIKEIIK